MNTPAANSIDDPAASARRRRWLFALALLPILGALQLTFLNMEEGGAPTATDRNTLPEYAAKMVDIARFDRGGDRVLHGTASTVTYFEDQSAQATDVHIETLHQDRIVWQLDSPTGSMPANQHRYLLEGPVQAHGVWPDSNEPVNVETTELWIDPEAHEFFSATPVALRSPHRNGDAVGMREDWLARRLQLLNSVSMTYDVPR